MLKNFPLVPLYPVPVISRKSIARMTQEAHEQGALLSMRDIGLLMKRCYRHISEMCIRWASENNVTLPHVGSLQDFGTCYKDYFRE